MIVLGNVTSKPRLASESSTAIQYDSISTAKSNTNEYSNIVPIANDENEKTSEIKYISTISISPKMNSTSEGRDVTTDSVIIYSTKHQISGEDLMVNNNIFSSTTLANTNGNETILPNDGNTSSKGKYIRHQRLFVL